MKQKRIIYGLLLLTSISNTYGMRRALSTLTKRPTVLVSARHLASLPHPKWFQNECYRKLKEDPKCSLTIEKVKEQSDNTKQTLLRLATQDHQASARVFAALLEAGANINKGDDEGQTPLHLLAQSSKNHPDETTLMAIFTHIAVFKPDFEARDHYGKTPRDYAPDKFKDVFKPHEHIDHPTLRYMHPGK